MAKKFNKNGQLRCIHCKGYHDLSHFENKNGWHFCKLHLEVVKNRPKISKKGQKRVRKKYFEYEVGSFEYNKNIQLINSYGITLKDYNKLLEEQNDCCAICGLHTTKIKKQLHTDHDHQTNKIRGLLCASCNMGIGNFKDNINIMLNSIEYLNKYND